MRVKSAFQRKTKSFHEAVYLLEKSRLCPDGRPSITCAFRVVKTVTLGLPPSSPTILSNAFSQRNFRLLRNVVEIFLISAGGASPIVTLIVAAIHQPP
jgi:hypothetical protein